MEVETYEVTETNPDTGLAELEPEALALIEELDLAGQREILTRRQLDDGEEVVTRCPYREMTAEEVVVYGYILPKKIDLEMYNRGPIPVRVLQVAALAIQEGWFEDLEVWCPANPADKDPLLVGKKDGKEFLLARWGEVLEAFDTLREKARAKWIREKRTELEEKLASLESRADRYFGGETFAGWV